MSSVRRIGLAAAAVAACVTGAFAATGFGEGDEVSSGFSYISGTDQGVATLGRGGTASGFAEAAGKGGGGGKQKVIVIGRVETVPSGQSFHETRKCPKRSVAVNGQFAPFGTPEAPEAFGVNMQGFAATSPRKWGFQFDNETADPVSALLGAVCLKNAKLDIRGPG
jgi:hypothetical protein